MVSKISWVCFQGNYDKYVKGSMIDKFQSETIRSDMVIRNFAPQSDPFLCLWFWVKKCDLQILGVKTVFTLNLW